MARDFNGTTDRIDSLTTVVASEPFTISCWSNPDAVANYQVISIADKDVANQQHRLGFDSGSVTVEASSFDGTLSAANTSTSHTAGAWHHIAGVWASASSRSAFLNGGGKGTNATATSITGLDRITLGVSADSTPSQFFAGGLAEVAVWNVALTDAEIAILATGANPRFVRPQNLVHCPDLIREVIDRAGAAVPSVTGTTVIAHPRVIYPVSATTFYGAAPAPSGGRIMSSLAYRGGLAGQGGIAGIGGGLAG